MNKLLKQLFEEMRREKKLPCAKQAFQQWAINASVYFSNS